jgi:chemotaxis protein methyltransferase CheR
MSQGQAAPAIVAAASHVEMELRLLMEAIYLKYSYDFRDYAGASQKRRVLQALAQFDCPTIPALQAKVLHDPAIFRQLLQYLTISVSEMFRDPTFFLALRQQVIPRLQTYPSVKIWVAGCSTGEEVYSLAILLKEEGLLERSLIYATDINARSLDQARQGIFSLGSIKNHTANYQKTGGKQAFSDYYTAAYDAAIFDKSLRENITFADHSLATDSVFSETQNRALGLFHESLSHRGFLGLGRKESIDFSDYATRFEPLVKSERIFRKL